MKVSINWLREYLNFDRPLKELADKLTMAGMEVEEIINISRQDFVAKDGEGLAEDVVFDSKVTPNRGDWLSLVGVAREAAPLVGGELKKPVVEVEGSGEATSDLIDIRIDDPDLCGRYVGVVVRNVRIGPSPGWMKDRLIASGMRPINNVVDITNYVMLELGQPLHAFDYALLQGKQIIVRRAKPGEKITSIDEVERELETDMLVIADAERAVAVAGVMGGHDTEVSEQTQDILIEAANFNPVSIRRTAKRLGMATESSFRFERGVDPSITPTAALRAAELMRDLAGGTICQGLVDVRPCPVEPILVEVRPERVNSVLGTSLTADAMVELLRGLEIEACVDDRGLIICRVPTFRQDITREIDLIEEVGRAYGYDNLEATLPETPVQGKDSPEGVFREKIRRILMSCGAQEALTHSLVDARLAEIAGRSDRTLRLRNPLSEELSAMRVSLIPNLLQVVERNQAFGCSDVSVFEIGKVYYNSGGEIGEKLSVAGAMVGNMWRNGWGLPSEALNVDFFTCKGIVECLINEIGIESVDYSKTSDPLLHPTRAAKVLAGEVEIGILGEVAPGVREQLDLRDRPCVFELDFGALMQLAPERRCYSELPKYPALYRHLSVLVSDSVDYAMLTGIVRKSGDELVEEVDLLDVYKGEQLGAGKRSLTLSVVFRSREKTLTDDEVNAVLSSIKDALVKDAGASFR